MGMLERRVTRLERSIQPESRRGRFATADRLRARRVNGSGDLPDLRRSRLAAAGTARRAAPDPPGGPPHLTAVVRTDGIRRLKLEHRRSRLIIQRKGWPPMPREPAALSEAFTTVCACAQLVGSSALTSFQFPAHLPRTVTLGHRPLISLQQIPSGSASPSWTRH